MIDSRCATHYPAEVPRFPWLLLICVCVGFGQTKDASPFSNNPKEIDVGRASFRLRCSACHGIHAEGGRGPALNRGEFAAGDTDREIYRVISRGIPGSEMPAFGARNTEDSIWRTVSYLRSLTPAETEAVSGDATHGETIFWEKSGCGNCHRVGTRGRYFGPALTRVGRSRSVAHLRESIVSPNEDLPPNYYAVSLRTKGGESILGLGTGFDDFSGQLVDSSGQRHSYFHDEVESMDRIFKSLMPLGYGDSLSAAELDDLLAYLVSLRGEEND